MGSKAWPIAAAALALAAGLAAAKPLADRQGARVQATSALDWLRHPDDARYYTESWTALMRSDQGHVVFVTFLYTNIGVVSGRCGVNVAVTMPGKQAQHFGFEYDTDRYKEAFSTGAIEAGPNRLVLKDGQVTMRVEDPQFRLSMKGRAWMPGVKLHNGRLWLQDDKSSYMDVWYHVPRGDFEAEMVVGSERVNLKGAFYLDHLAQNRLNSDFTTRWWTVRFFAPDHTVDLFAFRFNKDNGGERFERAIVTTRDRVLVLAGDVELKTDERRRDPDGHGYDTRYAFTIKGKDATISGTVTGRRLHDREAVMERLGWAQRGIAKLVAGNPIIYRQEADADLVLTPAEGEPIPLKGTAIIESIVNVDE
jgi:hypothetical protein